MSVASLSIRSVVLPITQIHITIRVDDPAIAFLFVIGEVAIVPGTIRPILGASAMALFFVVYFADVFDFGWKNSFFLKLWLLSTSRDHLLANLILPLELSQLAHLLHDYFALVADRLSCSLLVRVVGSEVVGWILYDILQKALC